MKKLLVLILVICLLPIGVFTKKQTKEDVLTVIENMKNIQVDDEIMIMDTKVNDNTIEFTMNENGTQKTVIIPYTFENNILTFTGGKVSTSKEIIGNQYAFYLYSILESMSTAPYEEENYYNNSQIKKKVESIENLTPNKKMEYYNTGKTFGLNLVVDTSNQISIYYQYFLDGDDTILINSNMEARKNEILTNPATGNYNFFITTLLLLVIGLAFYTYYDCKIKES